MMELHNIISGRYAEPTPSKAAVFEIDATIDGHRSIFAFASVPNDWNGLSADVAAWLLAHPDFVIEDYVEQPPPPYTLPVSLMFMRMTDDEFGDFDDAMIASADRRKRSAFRAAQALASDGDLFAFVNGIAIASIGADRAEEVMAEPDTSTAMVTDVAA